MRKRKSIKKKTSKCLSFNNKKDTTKIIKTRYSKKSWYYSIKNNESFYSDSLAEKYNMVLLDLNPNVKRWTKKHGLRIPYIYKGKSYNTIPDFLIEFQDGTLMVEEIKGRINLKELAKKEATENYCKHMNYLYKFTTTIELDKDKGYTLFLEQFKKKPKKK